MLPLCVCVCMWHEAGKSAAFVCMLKTLWLIQTGYCVGIIHNFKNSLWRHMNVCKHCIMTVIVVVGYDLAGVLLIFMSSVYTS